MVNCFQSQLCFLNEWKEQFSVLDQCAGGSFRQVAVGLSVILNVESKPFHFEQNGQCTPLICYFLQRFLHSFCTTDVQKTYLVGCILQDAEQELLVLGLRACPPLGLVQILLLRGTSLTYGVLT